MTPYVRFFDEIGAADGALVGGKGANLGEMTRAGLPVPPGFCLTAPAYRDFVEAAGLQPAIDEALANLDPGDPASIEHCSARIRQLISSQPMPPEIAAQLLRAYHHLARQLAVPLPTELPVAVRSSATAEDLPTASFAGQQETYLHVRGDQALLQRVKDCWASLWTARAVSYRARQGFDHLQVYLSVVVQAMIDAEVAGILFTANPVTGNRGEMVINASWGLGEAIASGLVDPDTIVVRKRDGVVVDRRIAAKEQMIVSSPAGGTATIPTSAAQRQAAALTDQQIAVLLALGQRVEGHYQAPQDVEWACAGGRCYLLQARPITTLPAAEATPDPAMEYSRTMFVEIFPQALTPSFASVVKPVFESMLEFTFKTLGFALPQEMEGVSMFYGQPYFNRSYIVAALQPLSPAVREQLATQIVSPFGRHQQEIRGELSPAYAGMVARLLRLLLRLPGELPGLIAGYRTAIAEAEALPLALLSDQEIFGHVRRLVLVNAREILDYDFLMIALIGITYQILGSMLKPHYGEDMEALRARLISGLTGNITMETNKRLWDLAEVARNSPATTSLLRAYEPEDVLSHLTPEPAAQDFVAALEAFLAEYGHREIRMDIIHPTWGEDPAPVLGFVRSYLDAGEARSPHRQQAHLVEKREALTAEVRSAMRSSIRGRLVVAPIFDWVLRQTQVHTRERDTIHFELTRLFPPLRAMLHELGRRWTEQGLLDDPDDIYYLTLEQATAMVESPQPMQKAVQAGRVAYRDNLSRSWPDIIRYGQEIYRGMEDGEEQSGEDGRWQGVAGSPHVATGHARIIRGPEEFHSLRRGEILVAPSTDPAWTPLFALAGAVVTEVGGILSHGAIVAREYGIPAVMGVRGITDAIQTGQRLTVDGNRGLVTLDEP